ncbi:tyrosine-type recombinase/integrase [Nitrosopumilus maritimus]|uniref:Integrase family protein n=1 Tax=Nitrosopumilus maritimus (strain SCM1) TaxID=436308 RepID=A9A380_NITMS|nr:tyrosine-type recombinase/integrase [Nitrosopumilus maritimus]ABX12509.1 integrase family protein [Nitrosopumilus maritimus SCM1]
MQSFLLKNKSKKSFLEGIQSLQFSTRENYQAGINRFEEFCKFAYDGRDINEIIKELKRIPFEQRDQAYFDVLQDFVNWLENQKLASATVKMYYQIATYYCSYNGIRAHPIDLKHNIKKPKKIKEKLHPLSKDEILKLFEFTPKSRLMLYLVLIGTGMRIQETVSLKKADFDFSLKRIKIEIPGKYTKTRVSHTTFVSKEAEKMLKPHLESLSENTLVFATNSYPFHAKMTEIEAFARYRKRAGLTEKYTSVNRHKFTLHSFRSYFFTRARRIHDTDIAHAMVGHVTYLDMYDRKDDDEKLELFLKVEPSLKIF